MVCGCVPLDAGSGFGGNGGGDGDVAVSDFLGDTLLNVVSAPCVGGGSSAQLAVQTLAQRRNLCSHRLLRRRGERQDCLFARTGLDGDVGRDAPLQRLNFPRDIFARAGCLPEVSPEPPNLRVDDGLELAQLCVGVDEFLRKRLAFGNTRRRLCCNCGSQRCRDVCYRLCARFSLCLVRGRARRRLLCHFAADLIKGCVARGGLAGDCPLQCR
mmetsp:Transcript_15806/g.38851  ORF Transcript_15806/g.38851 Transcript_15806/m.38851 type:complete len:213 (-) Transcript_15806:10-648(-)